jgi:hypothetical protein
MVSYFAKISNKMHANKKIYKCKMFGIRHRFWGIPNVRCLASAIDSGEFQM